MTHSLLILFMLLLALGPLALVWQDSRRRLREANRMRGLRHEAGLAARLRARGQVLPAIEWSGAGRR